jgi:hypothetical protein
MNEELESQTCPLTNTMKKTLSFFFFFIVLGFMIGQIDRRKTREHACRYITKT